MTDSSTHNSMSPRRSARMTATVVLIIVAFVSVLIGMGLDRAWYAHSMVHARVHDHHYTFSLESPTPAQRESHREQLAERLHLSDTQRQQLDTIMRRGAVQFDSLRGTVRPQVQHLIDGIRQHIEQILTPEQRELFIQMHKEQESRK